VPNDESEPICPGNGSDDIVPLILEIAWRANWEGTGFGPCVDCPKNDWGFSP